MPGEFSRGTARLKRAYANHLEAIVPFAAAVLVVAVSGPEPGGQQVAWVGIVNERGHDATIEGPVHGTVEARTGVTPPGVSKTSFSTRPGWLIENRSAIQPP